MVSDDCWLLLIVTNYLMGGGVFFLEPSTDEHTHIHTKKNMHVSDTNVQ